jgi:hypothetical protein
MRTHDDLDEAPLDPAQERLRRKLVRLLFVSGGIMALGLIAVFAAIVYKVGEAGRAREAAPAGTISAASPVAAEIALPPGHRLLATALDGDRALLTVETPDSTRALLLVDLATGTVIGRYAIVEK